MDIRKALKQLPKTLDETYDRILSNIADEDRRDAYSAMQLLVISFRPLTIDEVAEAIAVDCENDIFEPEDHRLGDVYDLLTICSSLITLSG